MIDPEIQAFLEHYGKKGMRWGQRRALRRESFRELKELKKSHKPGAYAAKKDPTFKREVKATMKRRGITIEKETGAEFTKKGGLLTSRILGEFKNSKGQKVSEDFANAVLEKAANKVSRRNLAKHVSVLAGAAFLGVYLGSR